MSQSYKRVFGEDYSTEWFAEPKDAHKNVTFVWHVQEYAKRLLKTQGYLYLDEVYMILGYEGYEDELAAGWIDDGETVIDFGIFHVPTEGMEWLKGITNWVELQFNVQDDIREKASIVRALHLAGEGLPWP